MEVLIKFVLLLVNMLLDGVIFIGSIIVLFFKSIRYIGQSLYVFLRTLESFIIKSAKFLIRGVFKIVKKVLVGIQEYPIVVVRGLVSFVTSFSLPRLPKLPRFPKISLTLPSFPKFKLPKKSEKETKVVFTRIPENIHQESIKTEKLIIERTRIRTRIRYFLIGLLTAMIIMFIQASYNYVLDLPNPKLIGNVNFPVSTQIYDRNDNLLYDVFSEEDRTPVALSELPDYVVYATLSIEDRNFYNHNGISVIGGILRAVKETWKTGDLQGGSTITQQLVKTSLLTPERTFERKFKEAILALWTERIYTKDEILELYLNQVAYGGTAYGIEEAAKLYFNESAKDLTLNQAAFLAGLTRAPSIYSPYINPQLAVQRRNEVLKSMNEAGYITREEYLTEAEQPLTVEPVKTFIRAPHFVFYVKSLMEDMYGIRRVEEGGLRIKTTLDIALQDEVEDILQEELTKIENLNVTNGAVVVTSAQTGEILAMVGSKNYYEEPYGAYNVAIARRQPGSSIKPLNYALAIENQQYTAATVIQDTPVVYNVPGSTPYKPVNYDNKYHGLVPLRYALANSYNVPAVKVLNSIGVQEFIQHAEKMGITTFDTPQRYGLSITLGGAEVRMIDMAEAFGVFANYGDRVHLNPVLNVTDFRGQTLQSFAVSKTEKVLSPQTSFIISDILSDNFARQFAFGPSSDLNIPGYKVAVKTGTTNDKRDNWTIGYTRKYVVAVWVGNNDNSPMNQILTSGVTGASPIWNRVMKRILALDPDVTANPQPSNAFTIPENIVSKTCHFGKTEYFIAGTENRNECGTKVFGSPSPAAPAKITGFPTRSLIQQLQ